MVYFTTKPNSKFVDFFGGFLQNKENTFRVFGFFFLLENSKKKEFSQVFFNFLSVHHNKFLYHKTTRCTNFTIYFGMKLYMFRTVPLSIIRSLFTVNAAMVHVIQVCR